MQARRPASNPLSFESAEAQVLANLRAQRLGAATVADLGLPEAFLRRVAGRVLQLSYQENFRLVVSDRPGATEHEVWKPAEARAPLQVREVAVPSAEATDRPVSPPPARGFFPRVLGGEPQCPREPAPGEGSDLVARSLARDGLLMTAARLLQHLPQEARGSAAAARAALTGAGFPADLLGHFALEGQPQGPEATIAWLAREVVPHPASAWVRLLRRVEFQFQPTLPGFRSNDDAGSGRAEFSRMQLSRGGYWMGPGDGGSIDVLEQLVDALPSTRHIALMEARHRDELSGALAPWQPEKLGRLSLVAHPFTLSQWAQDNGRDGHDGSGPATLVPRYATRGEEVSLYVPGDTFAAAGLVAAGLRVAHSPLLFQGGNLLTVQEPTGRRVLLIGEAEVYRNQALGLSRDQAINALCAEFGCDKGVVLPAASIHIDYEVTCRVHEGRVRAFVLDTAAGAKLVVGAALGVLVRDGLMTAAAATTVRAHIDAGRFADACPMVWSAMAPAAAAPGRFPLPFAARFRDGPPDSGIGNVHRLMAALDLLHSLDPRSLERVGDANLGVYYRSLTRRHEDRALLRAVLRNLGWTVVPVPGIGQGDRSINPLNGLHIPDAFLMPVYGGLFRGVDEAAAGVFRANLPADVRIIPVRTGESQRRDGALRCSVALG